MRYRCPKCHSDEYLEREVHIDTIGWQLVDEHLEPTGPPSDLSSDDDDIMPTGSVRCDNCDWAAGRRWLERIGIDGEPIADPIPGQMEMTTKEGACTTSQ